MLLDRNQAALLVVDMQARLLTAMPDSEEITNAAVWTVKLAKQLNMPIFFTEQYPAGLGITIQPLVTLAPEAPRFEKMALSCWADEAIRNAIKPFSQIIMLGVEAHVCLLQTVFELLQTGSRSVFVIEDAISSRDPKNKALALARMQAIGAQIVSTEMVFFEGYRTADHPDFREANKRFIQKLLG